MDYDHLHATDKIDAVGTLVVKGNMKKVLAEIAKCELVCATCHRYRSFKRMASL